MPHYAYSVRDRSGVPSSGEVFAKDEEDLRRLLRTHDLYLTSARALDRQARLVSSDARTPLLARRINATDMVIAMRQLATLTRSGIPLNRALETISVQSNKPKLEQAWKDIQLGVNEGRSLSEGMRKYPSIFNGLIVALVEAGEVAGTLDKTLQIAANQIDREDNMRKKVKAATFYPKLVIAAVIGTVTVMLLVVVPVFAKVYAGFHAELPIATRILMAVSAWAVRFWYLIIGMAVGVPWIATRFVKTSNGARMLDQTVLKLPIYGMVFRKIAVSRFVETLAGALRGGVPILKALGISANTAGNSVIRDAILDVAQAVRNGSPMGTEMERTGEFPLMVVRMIQAGEESSNLDEMLDEIAGFYERDVDFEVERFTKMIEPLMTILVGSIVLAVLLALYSPVFNLGGALKRGK